VLRTRQADAFRTKLTSLPVHMTDATSGDTCACPSGLWLHPWIIAHVTTDVTANLSTSSCAFSRLEHHKYVPILPGSAAPVAVCLCWTSLTSAASAGVSAFVITRSTRRSSTQAIKRPRSPDISGGDSACLPRMISPAATQAATPSVWQTYAS
jgi:hypothetical protein